jgi:HlyD family secretion protein
MDHLTLERERGRPRQRNAAAKRAFQDLLLEAFREREALLRGRVTLIPEREPATVDVNRSLGPVVDAPHNVHQLRWIETAQATARASGVEAGSDRRRDQPVLEVVRDRVQPGPAGHSNPALRVPPSQRAVLPPEIATLARSVAGATAKLPAIAARNVAEAFSPQQEKEADHDIALQRLWRRGLVFIAVFGGALSFWLIATTMSSAVIGSGQFVVDGNVKKVQHPTGGIVSQILVREGDQVSQGDLLIRLDETVTRANFQVVASQLYELFGRKGRLEAERDGRNTLEIPAEFAGRPNNAEAEQIIAAERRLFEARRAARESQRAQFAKRIAQLQNEILGLRSQLDANARETQIINEELKGVRELYEKRLTPIMRLNGLERQAVGLTGQKGQLTAQIAQTEGKIAEIELQVARIDEDLRAETQKELREVQGKIAELSERRIAADDNLKRVELRAPSAGTVHQLAVHTVGGVLSPAEPAMLIVPSSEELIVEAKVTPQDRDQLQIGQKVTVRVHSSNQRNTPELTGTLTRIAADVSKDTPSALPFYPVGVTVAKSELERLRGVNVTAGMQADVLIEVGSRSPLSYLIRPLSDQVAKSFRER